MNRLVITLCSALLLNSSAVQACDKHVVSDAAKKLLETVPSLATVECARDVLKVIALGGAATQESKCYQMTPRELDKAKLIANEKETSQALKNVFSS